MKCEKRYLNGRTTRCPSCGEEVRYSWLTGMCGPHLHFYANESNDVLLRTAWFPHIKAAFDQGDPDTIVEAEIDTFMASLPVVSAKKYSVWSNVKCPKCKNEFPYRFKGNLKLRLEDDAVILMDGSVLDTDDGIFEIEVRV